MWTEIYLLLCQRYMELNPVRAGMVCDPADCAWRSYRANALGQAAEILSPHPRYTAPDTDPARCREAYRHLFHGALGEAPLTEPRMALNQNQPFGINRFYAEIEAMTGQRRESRKRERPRRKYENERGNETRQQELPLNN